MSQHKEAGHDTFNEARLLLTQFQISFIHSAIWLTSNFLDDRSQGPDEAPATYVL